MSGLSKEFLESIDVHMDDRHFALFERHFNGTLFSRIEDKVIQSLSDEKVHELGELRTSTGDQVWQWLRTNVPDLGEIIRQEVDKILAEVVKNSDHL